MIDARFASLSLAARAVTVLSLLGLCGCGWTSKITKRSEPTLYELVLMQPPSDGAERGILKVGEPGPYEIIQALQKLREEKTARGLFLRIGSFHGSWGTASELRDALLAWKNSGRTLHCYFESADNAAYFAIARACERITAPDAGDLQLVGVAAQSFHVREALASVGLRADVLKNGRYKSAPEMFTRDDMSPEARENLSGLVRGIANALVHEVATGRRLTDAKVSAAIDAAPLTARRAHELGLIDAVAHADEARHHAREAAKAQKIKRVVIREKEEVALSDLMEVLSGNHVARGTSGRRIALVIVSGSIVDSESHEGGGASGPFVRALHRLRDDDEVEAIVLRIDSPGGSALASDIMWHAVREAAAKKPVVASLANVAASGGYYIASAATSIFATDVSIVGSIGVFGGKLVTRDLTDRLGIHIETITSNRNARWMSTDTPFSDSERASLSLMLDSTYERFIDRVASARNIPHQAVRQVAEGRVMLGSDGVANRLVDRVAGLSEAIDEAKKLSNAKTSQVEVWPPRETLLDALARALGGDDSQDVRLLESLSPEAAAQLLFARRLSRQLATEHVLVALPYALSIQ